MLASARLAPGLQKGISPGGGKASQNNRETVGRSLSSEEKFETDVAASPHIEGKASRWVQGESEKTHWEPGLAFKQILEAGERFDDPVEFHSDGEHLSKGAQGW